MNESPYKICKEHNTHIMFVTEYLLSGLILFLPSDFSFYHRENNGNERESE